MQWSCAERLRGYRTKRNGRAGWSSWPGFRAGLTWLSDRQYVHWTDLGRGRQAPHDIRSESAQSSAAPFAPWRILVAQFGGVVVLLLRSAWPSTVAGNTSLQVISPPEAALERMVAVGGFSAPAGEIPQVALSGSLCALEKRGDFVPTGLVQTGAALAFICSEHHVFRAAVVSIVLTLAVGQNAALLCSVWCHPPEATTGASEHQCQATSPSVIGNDSCTRLAAEATAFVREDVRRGASAPDAQHGVVVAWFQFAPPPGHSTSGRQLRQQTPPRALPLILALRI